MDKKEKNTMNTEQLAQLAEFRRQIDELDDKLVELLTQRIGIVKQVGRMKNRVDADACPLRPGREADMVRRIAGKFEGTGFSPAAAAAIWRTLIGASTAAEGNLTISVYTPERNDTLYWLAREYFGPFIPVIRQTHVRRVVGDIIDGKASVGLVSNLRSPDAAQWWPSLIQRDSDMPVIFAHVPFVYFEKPGNTTPSALAIARIEPEATEKDISIIVLEVGDDVSQHRIQTAFGQAGLKAQWLAIENLTPGARHHLIELEGFITAEHSGMRTFLKTLGPSVFHTAFLGAYAVPFTLPFIPTGK